MADRERPELLTCEYCGGEYRGVSGLHTHQSQMHSAEVTTTVGCTWCGSEIELSEWDVDDRNYCSPECSRAWISFLKQGERHPNYKDGSTTRGRAYELLTMAVRKRDEYACRRCGAEHTADGRKLHVHHITPEGRTDEPHQATNLVTLCDKCHIPTEKLPESEQLDLFGVESRQALELEGEAEVWYEAAVSNIIEDDAPDPCPSMFEEAQRVIEARNDD